MDKRIIIQKIVVRQGFHYIMECLYCHKHFKINGYRYNGGEQGQYCCRKCHDLSMKGVKRPKVVCKKISKGLTGLKQSPEHRLKNKLNRLGDKNWNWKGDKSLPCATHLWITKQKGKASEYQCADCGLPAKHWSNIDHSYKRRLSDYQPRCMKCHRQYDIKYNNYLHKKYPHLYA